jgi:hypothetical protein
MAKATVNLALPYTICDEENYLLSLDRRTPSIIVEYVQGIDTLEKITGMTTMGKMMIRRDYPEGLCNYRISPRMCLQMTKDLKIHQIYTEAFYN